MDYFCAPMHVERVQAWRLAHPGYRRAKPTKAAKSVALQDSFIAQVIDSIEEYSIRTEITEPGGSAALQDLGGCQASSLSGLIRQKTALEEN